MNGKRGKLLLTQQGGGAKTEIRPGRGDGWVVIDFEYGEDGARTKLDEKKSAADGYVIGLLKQDPEFFERFVRLANHPEVRIDA